MKLDTEFDVTAAGEKFAEYFIRNYPGPNTIIGNPGWHAPKIFRAALYALESSRAPVTLSDAANASAADVRDAARYRWLRKEREVTLIVMFFGNGCVNQTIEQAEGLIDVAAGLGAPQG